MKTIKISPSILSADFNRLGEEVKAVDNAGADYIHIDVMDGRFVPNITIGPPVVSAVRKTTKLPLDVHLMIEEPERYIKEFADAGSDIITVHAEASIHLNRAVAMIREAGAKAGVSINPSTPVSALECIFNYVDLILVMSVNPGFGGQSFIDGALDKVSQIRTILDRKGLDGVELEVDGGIKKENIGKVANAGADVFVAGSAVFGKGDYKTIIAELKKAAQTI